ncbi:homeodomain-interacting protein kinase 1-like [Archocentrus centrarchus]|uniref:homeodomain-interacting protein kinase 1-like n=1 Tax=Archocentrus centrarchus TaxID=63155 RepID=UPI0011E9E0A5|nr:homeodomain-interacting protein kinase 1-like [Archocentrus centrarchus]
MNTVAVKIVKNEYFRNGLVNMEVAALQKLKMHNSHKYNLVQFNRVLTNRQHVYLEFELLDKSLFELMKERHFQPLGLKSIRPIVQQIARALNHMKSVGIIHADLKLENVMLVNHQQEPYRVKVIDFSLACDVSSAKGGSRIQSRHTGSTWKPKELLLEATDTHTVTHTSSVS